MPTIPRSVIERYSRQLNAICDANVDALADALTHIDWTADVATIREQLVAMMQTWCSVSSEQTATLAKVFYDGLRSDLFDVTDGFEADVVTSYEPEATEGAVRAFVQDLVDGKQPKSVIDKCLDRLDYESRKSANKCDEHNVRIDPKKPKWARVPTGFETCEFCIMLASRDFVYGNEDLASHTHAHCDCRVVPSWDKKKASVEGYDPDLYYDMWKHPEKYPELQEARNARKRELYAEKRTSNGSTVPRFGQDLNDTFGGQHAIERYEGIHTPAREIIAGVKKGLPMSLDEADGGNVNPDYRMGGGYRNNCQSCVLAFIARLRGWAVQATPTMPGSIGAAVAEDTTLPWLHRDGRSVARTEYLRANSVSDTSSLLEFLENGVNSFRQYTFEFSFANGKGHIVNVGRDGAELWLYDGQTSAFVIEKQLSDYLDRIDFSDTPLLLDVTDYEFDQWCADNTLRPAVKT